MSDGGGFESGGRGGGSEKKPGGGFWDVMRKLGAGVLEGITSGVQARQHNGAPSVSRRDPVTSHERPAAARQVHRSLKAWRDKETDDAPEPAAEDKTDQADENVEAKESDDQGDQQAPRAAAADVKRKIHRAGDGKAAGSIKRLGQSGQDAAALKEALKQVQHERGSCVEELGILKASLEKLGLNPTQTKAISTKIDSAQNSIKDHLTDDDIAGAMRDAADDPVKAKGSGEPFDHAGEVKEGLASLKKLRDALSKLRKELAGRQIDAKNVASVLDPAMDALQQTMQRVGQAVKKVKKK